MPRPVANWREPGEYPERGAPLSFNRWAWEFLRRNPKYQDDWLAFNALRTAILADNGGDESQVEDDPRYWHHEPEREGSEDDAAWYARARAKGGKRTPVINRLAEKWKLSLVHLPNPFMSPASPAINRIGFVTGVNVTDVWHWDADKLSEFDRKTKIAFVIDLDRPLDGQIEALRRVTESRQQRLAKNGDIELPPTINERPEWSLYLRLLDADLAEATEDEVSRDIYLNCNTNAEALRKKIPKNRNRARELRDGGYLWIAAITPKRRNNSRTEKVP